MSSTNHQLRLAARPSGLPQPSDWQLTTEPVATPGAGEFVVAVSHLSVDPAMRSWMNPGASYIEPVEVGDVMRAGAVGRIVVSNHPGFAVGEHVYGAFGVQVLALSDGRGVVKLGTSLAPLKPWRTKLSERAYRRVRRLSDARRQNHPRRDARCESDRPPSATELRCSTASRWGYQPTRS